MPIWVASLLGGLVEVVGTLVGKVLVSLGMGYVTFTGAEALLDFAKSQFLTGIAGLPADAVAIAGLMKVGVCVSMLLSAYASRLLLMGLTSGTIKKLVFKSS